MRVCVCVSVRIYCCTCAWIRIRIYIDWCCFHYFVRNSLVATKFAGISMCSNYIYDHYNRLAVPNLRITMPTCCSMLQHVTACCSMLQRVPVRWSILQYVAQQTLVLDLRISMYVNAWDTVEGITKRTYLATHTWRRYDANMNKKIYVNEWATRNQVSRNLRLFLIPVAQCVAVCVAVCVYDS